jgi:hypothetical protein
VEDSWKEDRVKGHGATVRKSGAISEEIPVPSKAVLQGTKLKSLNNGSSGY